ncbi:lantibiotic immunity ABC transporter MutE/EpiE family permease subunit [Paenibacillus sanguinis]|uniref:lantibiotic immunity ABC transporter MutE/EpiE family permease subunit n=1 Tax=Paenibacillus sanguinis TaxID=225906 RepID=UPI00036979C7|nr:lantibiotic immunity ABC transporter MutE/EpiE family permease subunit [Paenibacillus sanguinis]
MMTCIQAELLKVKRTFTLKLVWLAPLLTLLLCAALMAGQYLQTATYNWWYTLLLPGTLTLLCTGVIQKDCKKLKYHAILGLPIHPSTIWLGKIGVAALLLLASSFLLFVYVSLSGWIFPALLSLTDSAVASLLLFLSFLWQVPLCLYLADRIGMFATLILNILGNGACAVLLATTPLWWIVPYAIPARLMCAAIGVLPNGLPVPSGDTLLDRSVMLPGVLVALVWFVLLSAITMLAFRNREAR